MFPTLFLSHGAPDLLLQASPFRHFLTQLGPTLGKPAGILVVSAHWLTAAPTISTVESAKTIHDFYGFPDELYQLHYRAPGAPELAQQIVKCLQSAGFAVQTQADRGLDHGAWEPLMLMYPEADIPVTQLSLQPQLGPAYHLRLGQALRALRDHTLIIGSGSATHHLGAFGQYEFDATPPDWVQAFDTWLAEILAQDLPQSLTALLNYRQQAPFAIENHPSEEHLLPLFVALGAAGATAQSQQIHASFTHGILSMASYRFD